MCPSSGMWEKDLLDRIALRQADANSFFAAICDNPDQAAAAYDTHSADMAKAGIEHLRARFDSNHAMALFGVGDDRRAVAKLRSAHAKLLGAAKARSARRGRHLGGAVAGGRCGRRGQREERAQAYPDAQRAKTFQTAFRAFCESRTHDRQRILRRKNLSVPCMLLLVASFVESEDLVPIVDEVLDAAEAFLRDDPKLAFDDTAWLGRRGLTLLLTALFMAVEASRTDDDDASEELARDPRPLGLESRDGAR
ncbi:hypothetical protein FNF27_08351 [Cafeteria roenbergensis]|uniref:Uncharacterized protein n=1 Tax=Cafeteria roenbergensis TaxID=33653 RepID=A0A5A8CZQ5_CAFRO|nr:hypothetical protein FNF27_08351 [Cafeteria roenbergensis]